MRTDLLEFVLQNIRSKRWKLTDVSTRAAVPYETLKKIANGTTPNPGVKHVQRLADFFAAELAGESAAGGSQSSQGASAQPGA